MIGHEPPPRQWRPDPLLTLILIWTTVTLASFWVTAVRGAFGGAGREWTTPIGLAGRGVSGDYWLLLIVVALALVFLLVGWRGAHLPFHWALVGWHTLIAASVLRLALRDSEALVVALPRAGSVALRWTAVLLCAAALLLSVRWVLRDLAGPSPPRVATWTRGNRRLAALAALAVPLQVILLRAGSPGGAADQAATLITYAQWMLISMAFYPWPGEATVFSPAVQLDVWR